MKKLFLLVLVCGFFAVGTTSAQNENYYGGIVLDMLFGNDIIVQ